MKKILRKIAQKFNFLYVRVYLLKGSSSEKKFDYERRFVDFKIKPGDKVLDAGSGGEPFPLATHLLDLYPEKTQHRYNRLKTDDKVFVQGDIQKMPFKDKEFDFVYCTHVLEHVLDPEKACLELMRVSKKGFIETPTRMSDIMFNFTIIPDFHRWHITQVGNRLIFSEYQEYEQRDIGTDEFYNMVHAKYNNRIQRMYRKNKDLFSNMLMWKGKFEFSVFDKKGNLISSSDGK